MSIELCVLASGSSGNCSLLRTPAGVVMIDAGIGPRTAAQRMEGTGVAVRDVAAVCLTHLDRDHFSPAWVRTLVRHGVRVFCTAERVEDLLEIARRGVDEEPHTLAALETLVEPFTADREFSPLDGVRVRGVRLAHDSCGSHGFVVDCRGARLGYATDLGRVPPYLIDSFEDLDVLAVESNYDARMQRESGRPFFLQRRITGGRGHLSNDEAFDAVGRILDRADRRAGARLPAHVVLLHRSRQCNCPRLLRALFERDDRVRARLTLAEQYERSEWLRSADAARPAAGEQLVLSF